MTGNSGRLTTNRNYGRDGQQESLGRISTMAYGATTTNTPHQTKETGTVGDHVEQAIQTATALGQPDPRMDGRDVLASEPVPEPRREEPVKAAKPIKIKLRRHGR